MQSMDMLPDAAIEYLINNADTPDKQTPDQLTGPIPSPEQIELTQQAKDALEAAAAIQTLQRIVPSWPRAERRALAKAIRLRGPGYTKAGSK